MRKLNRLCIYPKDVQLITGRSLGSCRMLLNQLRGALGKQRKDFVTVEEFCRYKGLDYEEVCKILKN